jgi:hypothetical protein
MNDVKTRILQALGAKKLTRTALINELKAQFPARGWLPGPVARCLSSLIGLDLVSVSVDKKTMIESFQRTKAGTAALKKESK